MSWRSRGLSFVHHHSPVSLTLGCPPQASVLQFSFAVFSLVGAHRCHGAAQCCCAARCRRCATVRCAAGLRYVPLCCAGHSGAQRTAAGSVLCRCDATLVGAMPVQSMPAGPAASSALCRCRCPEFSRILLIRCDASVWLKLGADDCCWMVPRVFLMVPSPSCPRV